MNRERVVGVVVMVVSMVAVALAINSAYQYSSYARCQAGVNEALIRSQAGRAEAAAQDRQSDVQESAATAELIQAVFTGQSTGERVAAYAKYRKPLDDITAQRAQTEEQRRANPLPAPPSQTCR